MSARLAMLLVGGLFVLPGVGVAEQGDFISNGAKIHYVVEGKGEPVLLIHGFTANIDIQWRMPGILPALAKNYRVIAYDNRGHGKSGKPHDPKQYGMDMVEDAVRLLDHLHIKKAHVVGYSMGAMITCKLLVTHPDRLRSATLGGAGGVRSASQLSHNEAMARSLEQGKGFGPLIDLLTPVGRPKLDPAIVKLINQNLESHNDAKALAAVLRGMKDLEVADKQLKANRVPTLALVGEIDPLKTGVDDLKGRLSHLKIVVIPGADHITAFAQPMFIKELKAFLANHSRRAKTPALPPAG